MNTVTVMITHKLYNSIILYMNKIIKEIASFLDNQNKEGDVHFELAGLNKDQIDTINNFTKAFNRNGYIPFPLKTK